MAGEARGRGRETKVARLLRADGWVCLHVKTGRDRGDEIDFEPPDLVAFRVDPADGRHGGPTFDTTIVWWLEVKSTATPWHQFGPQRRARLKAAAALAGVSRLTLAHWPKNAREPVYINSEVWPP